MNLCIKMYVCVIYIYSIWQDFGKVLYIYVIIMRLPNFSNELVTVSLYSVKEFLEV